MKLKTLLTSIGLGAGLMYFMDPQHGNRRRAIVVDRANRFVNDIDESFDIAVEDARNRARGVLSEMTARLSEQGAPDWILEERVRELEEKLFGHSHPLLDDSETPEEPVATTHDGETS